MNFPQAEDFLNSLMMFGIKLGLDQVRELLDKLGAPDQKLRFIHLAGSNGKGSVAVMLMAALRNAGFKVGFYSSPHLVSVRERFRIDGKAITEERFAGLIEQSAVVVEEMKAAERCPTYFELTTAVAALYFKQEEVDFVIWETGMGGRLDATSAVDPLCSIITGISLEHKEYLGDTIEQVAREKAGIIKPSKPVFIGQIDSLAEKVVRQVAADNSSPLKKVPDEWLNADGRFCDWNRQDCVFGKYHINLGLAGQVQVRNAALAVAVLEYIAAGFQVDMNLLIAGLSEARWPARLQQLPDGSLLDGAHNPEGAGVLVEAVKHNCGDKKFTVVFGGLADKDTARVIETLAEIAGRFVFVPVDAPRRCCPVEKLIEIAGEVSDVPAEGYGSLPEALSETSSHEKIICGSLFLAGKVLAHYYPEADIINI